MRSPAYLRSRGPLIPVVSLIGLQLPILDGQSQAVATVSASHTRRILPRSSLPT